MHRLERTLAIVFTAVGLLCLVLTVFFFSIDSIDSNPTENPLITLKMVFSILGFIFFSVGMIIIIRYSIRSIKLKTLLTKGQKISISSEAISVKKMNYSNAIYFVINLEWTNNINNSSVLFGSKEVSFNPEAFLMDRDITVYVNRNNYEDYYVDISFLPTLAKA